MSQIARAHTHLFPVIPSGDADWILTTTDMTTAGTQTAFTHENLPWGCGRLELSKSGSGSATVTLVYKRASGTQVSDAITFTATSGTYTTWEVAELISVTWTALAENLTIGAITCLYFYLDGFFGPSAQINRCYYCGASDTITEIGTKDTNWGYHEESKCAWVTVAALAQSSAILIQFHEIPE